jgi:tetratricopeptide (TPR) repeat protein
MAVFSVSLRYALVILAVCSSALASQRPTQPAPAPQPPLSAQEIFKRDSISVMLVESLDAEGQVAGFGSGVVVAPSRVITNRHVIENGVSFEVERGANKWPATLVQLDPDHDLAELSVVGLSAPPVEMRESSTLTVGERVYAIGAPEGLELTISEGLVSGLRDFDNARLIQTSAAISPGSSGGGLFDAEGRLVGITTFYLKEGQSLNFALPAEWAVVLNHQRIGIAPPVNRETATSQALEWFELGLSAARGEKWATAAHAFEEVLRLKPNDVWAWSDLSAAYAALGQYEKALSAAEEVVRLRPGLSVGWTALGGAYGLLRQYDKALGADQEAVRLDPKDCIAWTNLAGDHASLDEHGKATSAYHEALRLCPRNKLAWYGLGLSYHFSGQQSEVIKIYDKLKTLDPELADKFFREAVLP